MIVANDNLDKVEFLLGKKGEPRFVAFPVSERTVFYDLVGRGRTFALKRAGRTLIYPEMRGGAPQLALLHTAAQPHFLCPAHHHDAEAARVHRAVRAPRTRPGFIRGVVMGERA